jgi:hypothetical protein
MPKDQYEACALAKEGIKPNVSRNSPILVSEAVKSPRKARLYSDFLGL